MINFSLREYSPKLSGALRRGRYTAYRVEEHYGSAPLASKKSNKLIKIHWDSGPVHKGITDKCASYRALAEALRIIEALHESGETSKSSMEDFLHLCSIIGIKLTLTPSPEPSAFEGTWAHPSGALKRLRKHPAVWANFTANAEKLAACSKANAYQLRASFTIDASSGGLRLSATRLDGKAVAEQEALREALACIADWLHIETLAEALRPARARAL